MRTDRELLELAAKAAGHLNPIYGELSGDAPVLYLQNSGIWDPLGDDGDALRLAVQLRLHIALESHAVSVWKPEDRFVGWSSEATDDDPCAATRRAIVRAAAEIGSKLP